LFDAIQGILTVKLILDESDLRPLVAAIVAEKLSNVAGLWPLCPKSAEATESRRASAGELADGRIAYSEAEAAAMLGVRQHTLRDARYRGELTASKVGRRYFYDRAELAAFLARQRCER
jgi:excisionase family DNA binding protein